MHLYPDELTGWTAPVRSSQKPPELVRAEVAPLDWHPLQTEGPARRHIGVLPIEEDRDSDGLRGNQSKNPASRVREPNGGEE